jgi:hypothetical protein
MHKKLIEKMENQKVSWSLSGKRKKFLKKRFRKEFNRRLIEEGLEEYYGADLCSIESKIIK